MDAQRLLTLVLICLAAVIVGRRFFQGLFGSSGSGCGSCSGCSKDSSAPSIRVTPLIQLGMSLSEKPTESH